MKNQNIIFDVVIVGSGPAGVSAALPLVKGGLKTAILDGGLDNNRQDKKIDVFKEINFSKTSNAYSLIKKSSYVFNKTYRLLKIKSNVEIIQSLAKGGLSEKWHGIWDYFSSKELTTIGLSPKKIKNEYKKIAKRLNLEFDGKQKNNIYEAPLFPYSTALAVENLKKYKNLTYIKNQLVVEVKEKKNKVKIFSYSISNSSHKITSAKYIILAAGSINTTRILLKSLRKFDYKASFLTKPHYLIICLQLKKLLKRNYVSKFNQLVISSKKIKNGLETFFIQLYNLNTDSLFRVFHINHLPKIPLPFIIADVRFPAFPSPNKFSRLIMKNRKEFLEISFKEAEEEISDHKNKLEEINKQLHSLGLIPIKIINDYSASHYAGGVPIKSKETGLSVDVNCRLNQSRRIFVADASTWRCLPSKAPTFTIMANASIVGKNVLKDFKSIYQTRG